MHLTEWIQSARPGAKTIYYIGNLMADRELMAIGEITDDSIRENLSNASIAWSMAKCGLIHLLQRRDAGVFRYIAVRSYEMAGP